MIQRPYRLFTYVFLAGWLAACARTYQPVFTTTPDSGVRVDSSVPPDSSYLADIEPYKAELENQVNQVIGRAARPLTKGSGESLLGNLVADLTRIQAEKYAGHPVDLGLVADGGLRVPIDAGDITVNTIYELMPFENKLWVITLRGATVQTLFNELAGRKDLSVSNARVIVRNGKAVDVQIGGQPLDINRTYTLATSDYMALGGSNLPFLKEAIETADLDVLYRDAIIEYIKDQTQQGRLIDARIENRVATQE
jgi:2',3'-cyclic-nucleotide 2'-phosphodiesterase (5'-nucleotidase family)